jgi:hypothetical protein
MTINDTSTKGIMMNAKHRNYRVVNNSGCDIRPFDEVFAIAATTGVLPEELADLFSVKLLKGFNPDGSNRLIVEAA